MSEPCWYEGFKSRDKLVIRTAPAHPQHAAERVERMREPPVIDSDQLCSSPSELSTARHTHASEKPRRTYNNKIQAPTCTCACTCTRTHTQAHAQTHTWTGPQAQQQQQQQHGTNRHRHTTFSSKYKHTHKWTFILRQARTPVTLTGTHRYHPRTDVLTGLHALSSLICSQWLLTLTETEKQSMTKPTKQIPHTGAEDAYVKSTCKLIYSNITHCSFLHVSNILLSLLPSVSIQKDDTAQSKSIVFYSSSLNT